MINFRKRSIEFALRVFNHRGQITRDLLLTARHAWTMPYLGLPWKADPDAKSELAPSSYNNWGDVINLSLQTFIPMERVTYSPGTIACFPENASPSVRREKWFFINGICTSPPIAILNGLELAKAFHRPVHLIHNPTSGLVWDLWNSITARTLRKDGKLSRMAYNVVKEALITHDKVVLVGHSQGTLISSYISRKLLKDKQFRHHAPKLEIYCIAGVADNFKIDPELTEHFGRGVPYVEHYANGMDFFCRIGLLAHLAQTAGAVFVLPKRTGHLLNDHYLPGIWKGEYCDKRSRLFKYVDGKSPSSSDYVTHNYNIQSLTH